MDWQYVIDQFNPLTPDDLEQFASARDLEQAVHLFNKAHEQIRHDSADIALISLRKLASQYPRFGQAAALAGCLLAIEGEHGAAATLFEQAESKGHLPEKELELVQGCRSALQEIVSQQPEETGAARRLVHSVRQSAVNPQVLEKTRRRKQVKMASEKERQRLLREGQPADEETFVAESRSFMDYVRIGLPVLGVILLSALLVWGGIRIFSGRSDASDPADQPEQQLQWLLSRLQDLSAENPLVGQLLEDYQQAFTSDPDTAVTPGQTTETLPTETSEPAETQAPTPTPQPDPTPTPEPTPDPAVILLKDAARFYQTALDREGDDLLEAAEWLLSARNALETVADETKLPDQDLTAAELKADVEAMVSRIGKPAADQLRQIGRSYFNQDRYEEALEPYLMAFALDPGNYGGGVAYYCGRSYQLLGMYEEARPYYEYVIERFSGRDIADYAANRLRQMGY